MTDAFASNSKEMTLEERLVQTIKNESLMKLVGDEDAITQLVTRAIQEALFQPRRVERDYGRTEQMDSPLVEITRSCARTYADTIAKTIIEELLTDSKNKTILQNAIIAWIPAAINDHLRAAISSMGYSLVQEHTSLINSMRSPTV